VDFNLPLDYLSKKASDGLPLLLEWGTLIIAEENGSVKAVGLLDDVSLDGKQIKVSAGGYSMRTKEPYNKDQVKYVSEDPIKVFKDIYAYLESLPQGNLGILIEGASKSSGTVGTPDSPTVKTITSRLDAIDKELTTLYALEKTQKQALDVRVANLFKACGLYTVGKVIFEKSAPSTTKNVVWVDRDDNNKAYVYKSGWQLKTGVSSQVSSFVNANQSLATTQLKAKNLRSERESLKTKLNDFDDEREVPFTMSYFETQDLSSTVETLREAGPFEFIEAPRWQADGEEIDLVVKLGAPVIGSRREDLVFELGVNVTAFPTLERTDPYTQVLVTGSGEGSQTFRRTRDIKQPGVVHRTKVITDKDLTTRELIVTAVNKHANSIRTQQGFTISSLTVTDHSFARLTAFDLGDEIRVTGTLPDNTDLDLWVRITSITHASDTTLELEVVTL
jgi:hypothetical protein